MEITIIIAVYKDLKSLDLVIRSLNIQTYNNFEVIVAEDCQNSEMVNYLEKIKINFAGLKHVNQEDIGFRKTKILNEAVKKSSGKYLIFIDGDCICHKDFVLEYKKSFEENALLAGRRVMLSEKQTETIKNRFFIPTYFNLLFTQSSHREEGLKLPKFLARKKIGGLIGSNFGIDKKLLEKINGFDEDYCRAGSGEDDDIFFRVNRVENVKIISVRNRALQYHLFHSRGNREDDTIFNLLLLMEKKKNDGYKCKNGLEKL